MDRLPQELIEKITSSIPKDDLKNVLTLSNKFRHAAERCSGAFTEFTLNERNTQKFLEQYSGHRLCYLREVIFRPNLPPLWPPDDDDEAMSDDEDKVIGCRESADEIREKNECFTRQVHSLFTTLSTVEGNAGRQNARGRFRLVIHDPTRLIHFRINCPHHEFISWRVRLLNTELALVHSIRSLEIYNVCGQEKSVFHDSHDYPAEYKKCLWEQELKLDLSVMVALSSKLPNLEYLGCKTGGFEWPDSTCDSDGNVDPQRHFTQDWDGPRRDARHDFASAVAFHKAELPPSLQRASLDFVNPLQQTLGADQERTLPNLVGPALHDPFSSSLRILTNNLRQLRLWAVIDESLFRIDDASHAPWPNLEILEIMFHPSRPDGSWYFHGPRGQGCNAVGYNITGASYPPFETSELDKDMHILDDEGPVMESRCSNEFRVIPNEARLRPFLEGFAKAATRMRSLKRALIWSPIRWDPTWDDEESEVWKDVPTGQELYWGVQYSDQDNGVWGSPLPSSRRTEYYSIIRCLVWMVAGWRPDAELHSLFQNIGREKYGDDLVERWEEEPATAGSDELRQWMLDDYLGDPGRIPHSLS